MDKRLVWPVALAATLFAPSLRAQDEEPELNELLEVLKEETDIATKSRMNADFVPGIVTVLDGEKLEALGARTVWDALPFVPGVQATLDGTGAPSTVVRGIPFPFNSGSIQILVNGIAIGREAAGLNGSALYLPIEQVERIEFVRGPGSLLYGDAAFMGLLNVITRKTGNRADASVDSHQGRAADALFASDGGDWQTSLNLATSQSDDAITPIGTRATEDRYSGIFAAKSARFSFTAQTIGRRLNDVDGRPGNLDREEQSLALEARYDHPLTESLDFRTRVQYLHNDLRAPTNTFEGDQAKGSAEVFGRFGAAQTWVAGIEYLDGHIDLASINFAPLAPGQPPGPRAPPVRDRSRRTASLYAQDQIELGDKVSATIGARYDHSSEQGSRVTPRAALVYRLAERHVLKAQYTEGFRSPTFFERFLSGPGAPPDLDFEVNRTTELNYVYQRPHLTARATAYRTRIDDMVFRDFAHQRFANVAHASADGVELELSQQIGASLRVDADVSYVDPKDNRNIPLQTVTIASVPHWLAAVGVLYNPTPRWVFGLKANHIGDSAGAAPHAGEATVVDFAVTHKDFLVAKLDLAAGIANVFDERVVHLFPAATGVTQNPYQDRTAWAKLTWRW
jgi:iron complex outermembrane receptor protein